MGQPAGAYTYITRRSAHHILLTGRKTEYVEGGSGVNPVRGCVRAQNSRFDLALSRTDHVRTAITMEGGAGWTDGNCKTVRRQLLPAYGRRISGWNLEMERPVR